MFSHLARGIIRHPLLAIICWAVVLASGVAFALLGLGGENLFDRVMSGPPKATASDSDSADQIVTDGQPYSQSLTMSVQGVKLDDAELVTKLSLALNPTRLDLAKLNGVAQVGGVPQVVDPLNPSLCADKSDPDQVTCALHNVNAGPLIAKNKQGFLLTVQIERGLSTHESDRVADAVAKRLKTSANDLESQFKTISVHVGGDKLITDSIIDQMRSDLQLGELIAFPVALLVMVLVFAGFLAAAMPVVGAFASIGTAFGLLWALSYLGQLHTSVINVVVAIGLGLSIDYGLLVVSRFREELRRQGEELPDDAHAPTSRRRYDPVRQALFTTITTAGRTVTFSALTIAVCVAGLMVFRPAILRTFGLASFMVVLLALLTATTLVTALLALLGHHVARPSPLTRLPGLKTIYSKVADATADVGFFSKLAGRVQRHPWWVIIGVVAALCVLAIPVGHMELRNSSQELLPKGSDQRAFLEQLSKEYPQASTQDISVVSMGSFEDTEAWAKDKLAKIPGAKLQVLDGDGRVAAQRDGYVAVELRTNNPDDPAGPDARKAVAAIRSLPWAGFDVHVTGEAARLADFTAELGQGAPIAAIIIGLATIILLFLMTGSLIMPLKALITNALSILACLGVVTWVFQDGHLASVLGFSRMTGIESYMVVLLIIFGFGLAMDYEVFLISRIKEAWDRSGEPDISVRTGLQHSGRIITSAALIIVMVFAGFAAGKLVVIKELGVGLAFAVTIDATLVRMLLVPATMTLLGKWNWWAPPPLRWVHQRLHLSQAKH